MRDSVVRGIDRVDPFKDFHHGLLALSAPSRGGGPAAGKIVVAIARELAGFLWAALQPARA